MRLGIIISCSNRKLEVPALFAQQSTRRRRRRLVPNAAKELSLALARVSFWRAFVLVLVLVLVTKFLPLSADSSSHHCISFCPWIDADKQDETPYILE